MVADEMLDYKKDGDLGSAGQTAGRVIRCESAEAGLSVGRAGARGGSGCKRWCETVSMQVGPYGKEEQKVSGMSP